MAGAPRCCPWPLRQPNQCLPNACQSFQLHPSAFAFSGFEGAKRHRLCRPSGNPLGLNPADVPLEWLVPHDAAQGRYVNPTNACQSFQPHPSTFAFSGFEGAKRHRLCRPSGNPLLGFCCFGRVPTRWKMHPGRREEVSAPPTQAFIGHHPVHAAVSHACSPATLAAVTCLWSGWCHTMLPRAVTSTQPMPAKASSPTHPPLLLAGSKVLNGTGSADQVATRWA